MERRIPVSPIPMSAKMKHKHFRNTAQGGVGTSINDDDPVRLVCWICDDERTRSSVAYASQCLSGPYLRIPNEILRYTVINEAKG